MALPRPTTVTLVVAAVGAELAGVKVETVASRAAAIAFLIPSTPQSAAVLANLPQVPVRAPVPAVVVAVRVGPMATLTGPEAMAVQGGMERS